MSDIWKRDEIMSPCINVCVLHPATGLCLGCARSGDEIADWGAMNDADRAEIMAELPDRSAAPKGRRGGRKARQG